MTNELNLKFKFRKRDKWLFKHFYQSVTAFHNIKYC